MNVRDWINTVNAVTFSSLTNQFLWMMGSLVFTAVAAWLMTRPDQFNDVGVLIASRSGMRAVGVELAMALLFAWTGKSVITAASRYGKSTTAVPYVEAKERGKAAAPKEKPDVTIEAKDRSTVTVDASDLPPKVPPLGQGRRRSDLESVHAVYEDNSQVEHEWARGDPREGVL